MTNENLKITAKEFGKEFASGFIQECLKCMFIFFAVLLILKAVSIYLVPVDDCDVDRYNRCGLKVVTDAKTGKQYLLSPHGGIIERK